LVLMAGGGRDWGGRRRLGGIEFVEVVVVNDRLCIFTVFPVLTIRTNG
jgi:hypothetical protein